MASDQKLSMAFELLRDAEEKLSSVRHLLESESGGVTSKSIGAKENVPAKLEKSHSANIIEGVFDGHSMIGEDKKIYPVPANYASKSKLVEGDTLKLTIVDDGSFVFKQIGPVERKHIKGTLCKDERGECFVKAGRKEYRVLTASVTYFKGSEGDEITLIVPQSGHSEWGAVENIIRTVNKDATMLLNRHSDSIERENKKAVTAANEYDKSTEQAIPIEEGIDKANNSSATPIEE